MVFAKISRNLYFVTLYFFVFLLYNHTYSTTVLLFSGSLEQLKTVRPSGLQEADRLILERFSDSRYIDALLKFVSAEDFSHAEFDSEYFLLFRGLFRHCGDVVVPGFLPHLQRMVASIEEHDQRAATEILTGLIRGSKRWPYAKVSKLWAELIPIIRTALNNITGETQGDWQAFAGNSIG